MIVCPAKRGNTDASDLVTVMFSFTVFATPLAFLETWVFNAGKKILSFLIAELKIVVRHYAKKS